MKIDTCRKYLVFAMVLSIFSTNSSIVFGMYDTQLGRFTTRDPVSGQFEEPMTLHKYLYCGNDPTNYIDPSGLWGTTIHNQIIDEAYSGMDQMSRNFIYSGSKFIDIYYQTSKNAYTHAMRAPGQSVEVAQNKMWGFVFHNLSLYEQCRNGGGKFGGYSTFMSYEYLGRAMHPIMDSTDPAHNWQEWALTPGYISSHHDPKTIDAGTLDTTVSLMKDIMLWHELSDLFK